VHQGTTLTSVEIPQNGRVPCYFLNGLKSDLEGLEYDWICLTSASGLGRHRLGRLCHRRPDDGLACICGATLPARNLPLKVATQRQSQVKTTINPCAHHSHATDRHRRSMRQLPHGTTTHEYTYDYTYT